MRNYTAEEMKMAIAEAYNLGMIETGGWFMPDDDDLKMLIEHAQERIMGKLDKQKKEE